MDKINSNINAPAISIPLQCYTDFKLECRNDSRKTSHLDAHSSHLLNEAAKNGNHEELLQLLLTRASIHSFGPFGMNPLHAAAQNGHLKVCQTLINFGVVVNSKNKIGKTPLHLASTNGHTKVVTHLLSSGALVNEKDLFNMTPLDWACERGHIEVVKSLLCRGADFQHLNNFHKSALMIANEKEYYNIVTAIENWSNKEKNSSKNSSNTLFSSSHFRTAVPMDDNLDDPNDSDDIFTEQFPPNFSNEETVETDDIDEFVDQIQENLSNFASTSAEQFVDDTLIQDNLLEKLEKMTSAEVSVNELDDWDKSAAAELLRAQVELDAAMCDPVSDLLQAADEGRTIMLTEAGRQALAMVRPEPFIIPFEEPRKQCLEESSGEEEEKDQGAEGGNACSAVALCNKSRFSVSELIDERAVSPSGPPLKRYKT